MPYRKKNRPESQHANSIKRLYGLSKEDYAKMLEEQGGVCAICRRRPDGVNLCVDHDHETDKVRGLLCRRCNSLLGYAQDEVLRLLAAVNYLEETACG